MLSATDRDSLETQAFHAVPGKRVDFSLRDGMIHSHYTRIFDRVLFLACVAAVFRLGSDAAYAQYRIFAWDSFENGAIPPQLIRRHEGNEKNIAVFDFTSPEAPQGILDGPAKNECGRYGIAFRCAPKENILSVVNPLALDRQLLGVSGRALYQADLFIPAENTDNANIAVLAVPLSKSWLFYRLGLRGGAGKKVYFSYVAGGEEPQLAFDQVTSELFQKRPGWHRFQIIFEGQETIHCAVDGKMTRFSPFKEASQTVLQAGIMAVSRADQSAICYADNLSIQWTPEDVPLPDSPWAESDLSANSSVSAASNVFPGANAPTPSAAAASATTTGPQSAYSALSAIPANAPGTSLLGASASAAANWFTNLEEGRQAAIREKRPLLILFYAPRAKAQQSLNTILATAEAQSFLQPFARVRLDVNQLSGGAIAQQYAILRVPCFVAYSSDGVERARLIYMFGMEWKDISPQLQAALPSSAPAPAAPSAPGSGVK